MMKKQIILAVVALFGFNLSSKAQITISTDSIAFNAQTELQIDSAKIWIKNNGQDTIRIKEIRKFALWSAFQFSSRFNDSIIHPNDSVELLLFFEPTQNMFLNSELLLVTEPSQYSRAIDVRGQGKFSNPYYNATENLSEEDLKAALKTIITSGYVSLGYNTARDKMFMEYDNQMVNGQGASVNTLECVYTGRKALSYTSRTDAQTNQNFNTEHTFPQGFFSQNEPMRSDLHHLFPTDENANNSRNNFAFGVATQPYQNDVINNPSHLGANGLYEPRDAQKGKTARAMMYFVLRYQDYTNFFASQETILRLWHKNFLPNAIEKKRNSDIATSQKNRNPFVDYPQFIERIQKIVGTSVSPNIYGIDFIEEITCSSVIDSLAKFTVQVPIVNTGNKTLLIRNFITASANANVLIDSLNISSGEAGYIPVEINATDTTGLIAAYIQFNSNASLVQHVFNIQVNVTKTAVGQNDFQKQSKVLYPNPADDYLILPLQHEELYSIFNLQGQELYHGKTARDSEKIDISWLPAGSYFVKSTQVVHRFIKK